MYVSPTGYAGLGLGPAVVPIATAAGPTILSTAGKVIGTVTGVIGGLFGGGVSAADRAQHMANLQTLYQQALAGDQTALCRLQTAGGVGVRNGTCGGQQYGTFSDSALKAEAAKLYYQVTQSGVVPGPTGGPGGLGGIGTGTLLAVGAGAVLLFTLARRKR